MPKKQRKESAKEQAVRFAAEVAQLIEAGELSPTEADDRLDRMVKDAGGRSLGRSSKK